MLVALALGLLALSCMAGFTADTMPYPQAFTAVTVCYDARAGWCHVRVGGPLNEAFLDIPEPVAITRISLFPKTRRPSDVSTCFFNPASITYIDTTRPHVSAQN